MTDIVKITLDRLTARGAPVYHAVPPRTRVAAILASLFGLPAYTHYYECLDGRHFHLTEQEKREAVPIEMEVFSEGEARRLMRARQAWRDHPATR